MKLTPTQQQLFDQLEQDKIKDNPALRCALALERIARAVERLAPAPMFPVAPVSTTAKVLCGSCAGEGMVSVKKYTEEPHDRG